MTFEAIDISDKQKWNSVISGFAEADPYYYADYISPFCNFEHTKGILFHYRGIKTELCYPVVLQDISDFPPFRTHIAKGEVFDIATPYGYGGPVVNNFSTDDIEDFFIQLKSWARENNIISHFFRFHPLLENHRYFKDFVELNTFKKTVFLDLSSEEIIYKNLNDKCRNALKKALKNDIKVVIDNSVPMQKKFVELYKSTMQRNGASDYYYFNDMFFENLFKTLGGISNIFSAVYNDEVVSSAIIFSANQNMHYHLSAANREYMKLSGNNLLLYEIARYGARNGFAKFHLGGGVDSEDGLFIFKKCFNKNGLLDFYIGRIMFDIDRYNDLMLMRKKIDPLFNMDTNFMIAYRSGY